MQNAGHYGPGTANQVQPEPPTQHQPQYHPEPSEPSPTGSSMSTTSLRQFRKKDVEKGAESGASAQKLEARVAPHSHYPASHQPPDYRYLPMYHDYSPNSLGSQPKYDLSENHPSQNSPISTSVIQKPKHMEICQQPPGHLKQTYPHQLGPSSHHQGYGMENNQLLQSPTQMHPSAYQPAEPQYYSNHQMSSHHAPKYHQMMPPQNMRKYQNPGEENFLSKPNSFLSKLSKLNPTMARSIMSEHQLQESMSGQPPPAYPGMDQRGMYQNNQRYYTGSMHPSQMVYASNNYPPMNYPNFSPSCNYNRPNKAPHNRYNPQLDRDISPSRRPYSESLHHMAMCTSMPQKLSNYPPHYNSNNPPPEYAQHYRHRRDAMSGLPQDYYQQSPGYGRPPQYMGGHEMSPGQNLQDISEAGPVPLSDNLKKFVENWIEEEDITGENTSNSDNGGLGAGEQIIQVSMVNPSDVPLLENRGIPIVTPENGHLSLTSEGLQYLIKSGIDPQMVKIIEANNKESITNENGIQEKVVRLHIVDQPKTDCMMANQNTTSDETDNRKCIVNQNKVLPTCSSVSSVLTGDFVERIPNINQNLENIGVCQPNNATCSDTKELVDKNCSPINSPEFNNSLNNNDIAAARDSCIKSVETKLDGLNNSEGSRSPTGSFKSMPIIDAFENELHPLENLDSDIISKKSKNEDLCLDSEAQNIVSSICNEADKTLTVAQFDLNIDEKYNNNSLNKTDTDIESTQKHMLNDSKSISPKSNTINTPISSPTNLESLELEHKNSLLLQSNQNDVQKVPINFKRKRILSIEDIIYPKSTKENEKLLLYHKTMVFINKEKEFCSFDHNKTIKSALMRINQTPFNSKKELFIQDSRPWKKYDDTSNLRKRRAKSEPIFNTFLKRRMTNLPEENVYISPSKKLATIAVNTEPLNENRSSNSGSERDFGSLASCHKCNNNITNSLRNKSLEDSSVVIISEGTHQLLNNFKDDYRFAAVENIFNANCVFEQHSLNASETPLCINLKDLGIQIKIGKIDEKIAIKTERITQNYVDINCNYDVGGKKNVENNFDVKNKARDCKNENVLDMSGISQTSFKVLEKNDFNENNYSQDCSKTDQVTNIQCKNIKTKNINDKSEMQAQTDLNDGSTAEHPFSNDQANPKIPNLGLSETMLVENIDSNDIKHKYCIKVMDIYKQDNKKILSVNEKELKSLFSEKIQTSSVDNILITKPNEEQVESVNNKNLPDDNCISKKNEKINTKVSTECIEQSKENSKSCISQEKETSQDNKNNDCKVQIVTNNNLIKTDNRERAAGGNETNIQEEELKTYEENQSYGTENIDSNEIKVVESEQPLESKNANKFIEFIEKTKSGVPPINMEFCPELKGTVLADINKNCFSSEDGVILLKDRPCDGLTLENNLLQNCFDKPPESNLMLSKSILVKEGSINIIDDKNAVLNDKQKEDNVKFVGDKSLLDTDDISKSTKNFLGENTRLTQDLLENNFLSNSENLNSREAICSSPILKNNKINLDHNADNIKIKKSKQEEELDKLDKLDKLHKQGLSADSAMNQKEVENEYVSKIKIIRQDNDLKHNKEKQEKGIANAVNLVTSDAIKIVDQKQDHSTYATFNQHQEMDIIKYDNTTSPLENTGSSKIGIVAQDFSPNDVKNNKEELEHKILTAVNLFKVDSLIEKGEQKQAYSSDTAAKHKQEINITKFANALNAAENSSWSRNKETYEEKQEEKIVSAVNILIVDSSIKTVKQKPDHCVDVVLKQKQEGNVEIAFAEITKENNEVMEVKITAEDSSVNDIKNNEDNHKKEIISPVKLLKINSLLETVKHTQDNSPDAAAIKQEQELDIIEYANAENPLENNCCREIDINAKNCCASDANLFKVDRSIKIVEQKKDYGTDDAIKQKQEIDIIKHANAKNAVENNGSERNVENNKQKQEEEIVSAANLITVGSFFKTVEQKLDHGIDLALKQEINVDILSAEKTIENNGINEINIIAKDPNVDDIKNKEENQKEEIFSPVNLFKVDSLLETVKPKQEHSADAAIKPEQEIDITKFVSARNSLKINDVSKIIHSNDGSVDVKNKIEKRENESCKVNAGNLLNLYNSIKSLEENRGAHAIIKPKREDQSANHVKNKKCNQDKEVNEVNAGTLIKFNKSNERLEKSRSPHAAIKTKQELNINEFISVENLKNNGVSGTSEQKCNYQNVVENSNPTQDLPGKNSLLPSQDFNSQEAICFEKIIRDKINVLKSKAKIDAENNRVGAAINSKNKQDEINNESLSALNLPKVNNLTETIEGDIKAEDHFCEEPVSHLQTLKTNNTVDCLQPNELEAKKDFENTFIKNIQKYDNLQDTKLVNAKSNQENSNFKGNEFNEDALEIGIATEPENDKLKETIFCQGSIKEEDRVICLEPDGKEVISEDAKVDEVSDKETTKINLTVLEELIQNDVTGKKSVAICDDLQKEKKEILKKQCSDTDTFKIISETVLEIDTVLKTSCSTLFNLEKNINESVTEITLQNIDGLKEKEKAVETSETKDESDNFKLNASLEKEETVAKSETITSDDIQECNAFLEQEDIYYGSDLVLLSDNNKKLHPNVFLEEEIQDEIESSPAISELPQDIIDYSFDDPHQVLIEDPLEVGLVEEIGRISGSPDHVLEIGPLEDLEVRIKATEEENNESGYLPDYSDDNTSEVHCFEILNSSKESHNTVKPVLNMCQALLNTPPFTKSLDIVILSPTSTNNEDSALPTLNINLIRKRRDSNECLPTCTTPLTKAAKKQYDDLQSTAISTTSTILERALPTEKNKSFVHSDNKQAYELREVQVNLERLDAKKYGLINLDYMKRNKKKYATHNKNKLKLNRNGLENIKSKSRHIKGKGNSIIPTNKSAIKSDLNKLAQIKTEINVKKGSPVNKRSKIIDKTMHTTTQRKEISKKEVVKKNTKLVGNIFPKKILPKTESSCKTLRNDKGSKQEDDDDFADFNELVKRHREKKKKLLELKIIQAQNLSKSNLESKHKKAKNTTTIFQFTKIESKQEMETKRPKEEIGNLNKERATTKKNKSLLLHDTKITTDKRDVTNAGSKVKKLTTNLLKNKFVQQKVNSSNISENKSVEKNSDFNKIKNKVSDEKGNNKDANKDTKKETNNFPLSKNKLVKDKPEDLNFIGNKETKVKTNEFFLNKTKITEKRINEPVQSTKFVKAPKPKKIRHIRKSENLEEDKTKDMFQNLSLKKEEELNTDLQETFSKVAKINRLSETIGEAVELPGPTLYNKPLKHVVVPSVSEFLEENKYSAKRKISLQDYKKKRKIPSKEAKGKTEEGSLSCNNKQELKNEKESNDHLTHKSNDYLTHKSLNISEIRSTCQENNRVKCETIPSRRKSVDFSTVKIFSDKMTVEFGLDGNSPNEEKPGRTDPRIRIKKSCFEMAHGDDPTRQLRPVQSYFTCPSREDNSCHVENISVPTENIAAKEENKFEQDNPDMDLDPVSEEDNFDNIEEILSTQSTPQRKLKRSSSAAHLYSPATDIKLGESHKGFKSQTIECFLKNSNEWEDTNSPKHYSDYDADNLNVDFSGLIVKNSKPIIDVDELKLTIDSSYIADHTESENPTSEVSLEEYQKRIDSELSSLNINIPKSSREATTTFPKFNIEDIKRPLEKNELVQRFLSNKKISEAEVEIIQRILSYKKTMLQNVPSDNLSVLSGNSQRYELKNSGENRMKLHFKRLGSYKRKIDFESDNKSWESKLPKTVQYYLNDRKNTSVDYSDYQMENKGKERITSQEPSCSRSRDDSEPRLDDYSVQMHYNSAEKNKLPKIIFKRTKASEEPVVVLERMEMERFLNRYSSDTQDFSRDIGTKNSPYNFG